MKLYRNINHNSIILGSSNQTTLGSIIIKGVMLDNCTNVIYKLKDLEELSPSNIVKVITSESKEIGMDKTFVVKIFRYVYFHRKNSNYVLSLDTDDNTISAMGYNESINGFVSFIEYKQRMKNHIEEKGIIEFKNK